MTPQQEACIPRVEFKLIPIKDLVSNQNYQRQLSENHILNAVRDFDIYQVNAVKVSRRDGINYVFDGQHTIEIIASKSGSRDTPVWCMIYPWQCLFLLSPWLWGIDLPLGKRISEGLPWLSSG